MDTKENILQIHSVPERVKGQARAERLCLVTYRIPSQVIRTPAFSSAKVLQVVQVVDAGRKGNLPTDGIKLLRHKPNIRRASATLTFMRSDFP